MKLSGQRILVTGAAGFIGSHLADRLAAAGNELILVDDLSVGLRENLTAAEEQPGVRFVAADITDRERMEELVRGVDVLFHLAISCLRTSINRPYLSHDINAGGTLSVCMAARAAGVKRLIYVSSSEVYGTADRVPMDESHPLNPMTVYGAAKAAGELYALACWRTYGLPVSVVRPFNTYGPREPYQGARAEVIPRFILLLEAGRSPVVHGKGDQTRDFTYVDDTVTGLIKAAECDALVGDSVNIARGSEVSIVEIADHLRALTGRSDVTVVHADERPGDVHRHFADASKAERLFGFAPAMDIREGLERTVAWFREHRIADRVDAEVAGAPNW